MKLERDRKNRSISLSQPAYIDSILETYRMRDCNTTTTPMSEKAHREALGKLLYLSIATRPDISYAVGVLCRFSENPMGLIVHPKNRL